MLTVMLAAMALLADTTPAAAQAAPPAAAPAAAAAKPAARADSDIVCRKEAILGSNIPKKVCYSKAEYEENRKETRQNVEHMQNNIGIHGN